MYVTEPGVYGRSSGLWLRNRPLRPKWFLRSNSSTQTNKGRKELGGQSRKGRGARLRGVPTTRLLTSTCVVGKGPGPYPGPVREAAAVGVAGVGNFREETGVWGDVVGARVSKNRERSLQHVTSCR